MMYSMKYSILKTLAGFALTLAAISSTAVSFGDTVTLYAGPAYSGINGNPYQNGQGGEFTAITSGGVPAGYSSLATYTLGGTGQTGFQTFCVEGGKDDVYFTPGHLYTYGTSDQIKGGPMGTLDLTVGVAWLYSRFATGQLGGYYAAANRNALAGDLQNAFWTLENEQATPLAGWVNSLLVGQFGNQATWSQSVLSSGNGDYGVKVMNLWDAQGAPAQNQLIYTGSAVPDSCLTLGLLGATFAGLALIKRRVSVRK